MNDPVKCVRCQTTMEAGHLPDLTYGGYMQQVWISGEPKRSFWGGIKVRRGETIPVATLRCPRCGYLESYAKPANDRT